MYTKCAVLVWLHVTFPILSNAHFIVDTIFGPALVCTQNRKHTVTPLPSLKIYDYCQAEMGPHKLETEQSFGLIDGFTV